MALDTSLWGKLQHVAELLLEGLAPQKLSLSAKLQSDSLFQHVAFQHNSPDRVAQHAITGSQKRAFVCLVILPSVT